MSMRYAIIHTSCHFQRYTVVIIDRLEMFRLGAKERPLKAQLRDLLTTLASEAKCQLIGMSRADELEAPIAGIFQFPVRLKPPSTVERYGQ